MSFFLGYVTPRYTNLQTISTLDTSGSYPPGEVYTDTSSDGLFFYQMFSGSQSVPTGATLAPVKLYYDPPVGPITSLAVLPSLFITINDTSLGVMYQLYIECLPEMVGKPWRLEINDKKYGSTNPRDFTYVFTSVLSTITINS